MPAQGSGVQTFLPIQRDNDWQSVTPPKFDQASLGLIYTLAVLFLINTLVALWQLGQALLSRTWAARELLGVFVLLFNLVRSIYFFILGSTDVAENERALDYALVRGGRFPTYLISLHRSVCRPSFISRRLLCL